MSDSEMLEELVRDARERMSKSVEATLHEFGSVLVESGSRWDELQAVHLNGTIELVDDEGIMEQIDVALFMWFPVGVGAK